MREVHCPNCNATNRRPKCGNCQKEIADPPEITLAWKVYQHRTAAGVASAIVLLVLIFWRPLDSFYFFDPANSSECEERAARSARSNDAMRVLLRLCYEKFPGKP